MSIGVYTLTCKKNGMVYVGESLNLEQRIRDHVRNLKKGLHSNVHLQSDYDKYGCYFDYKIVHYYDGKDTDDRSEIKAELKMIEDFLIRYYTKRNKCYNVVHGDKRNRAYYRKRGLA